MIRSYTQSRTNNSESYHAKFISRQSSRCFRLRATFNARHEYPFVRDGDKNIRHDLAKTTSRENGRFQFHPVIRTAPKDMLRTAARRDGRRFAFPVRGISFRVLGSFPKQTETGRLNGHRIATATPNYRKRERNANSTGTSTSCASYRGSF